MSVKRFDISGEHYEVFGDNNGEYCLYEDYAALEARCAALAAENAGLKQFPDQIVGFVGKLGSSEIGSETKEKIEAAAKKIKTPATDAFLAEVRAQAKADGVQEYADSFRHSASKIRECYGDNIRVRALLHEANNADDFAAQLRKGVQS